MSDSAVRQAGVVLVRFLDQGGWSIGSFAVSAWAAATMTASEFAAISAALAIAFIVLAVARAWAVTAPVVVGAKERTEIASSLGAVDTLRSSFVWATLSALVVVGLMLARGMESSVVVGAALLCMATVVVDGPRQVAILIGLRSQSAILSVGSMALIAAIPVAASRHVSGELIGWSAVLAGVAVIYMLGARRAGARSTIDAKGHRLRLAAEAAYTGLGNQLGLLALFFWGAASTASGYRLAYSIGFAPAFMVIQSVGPIYLGALAAARKDGRSTRNLARLWSVIIFVLTLGTAVFAAIAFTALRGHGQFSSAVPYLAPVGVAMLGAQVFEAVLMDIRLWSRPSTLHRIRLASVGVEVAAQVIGLIAGGVRGLIVAVVVVGIVRIAWCLMRLFTAQAQDPESGTPSHAQGLPQNTFD